MYPWEVESQIDQDNSEEYFFCLEAQSGLSLSQGLIELHTRYSRLLSEKRLSEASIIFSRFFLSDMANQITELRESSLFNSCQRGAVSIVEQPPLEGGRVGFHCYHLRPKFCGGVLPQEGSQSLQFPQGYQVERMRTQGATWTNHVEVRGAHYRMGWITNLIAGNCQNREGLQSPETQTEEIFQNFIEILKAKNLSLLKHVIRTWIYVRDIDNNYAAMVKARRNLFEKQGLTSETRFIASTGIQGKLQASDKFVGMDGLYFSDLKPEQIVRMEALENMNPTSEYGVTFERGTRIRFGDRSHLYISGTASIDHRGRVLYVGDAEKQTHRILDNIEALLRPQGASLENMVYLFVYLRDPNDLLSVIRVLDERFLAKIPRLIIQGAVCRPEWLVEIEGLGIIKESAPYPNFI